MMRPEPKAGVKAAFGGFLVVLAALFGRRRTQGARLAGQPSAQPAEAAALPRSTRSPLANPGYEVSDTKASAIGWVMLIAVLIIAASIAVLFGMIGQFRASDRQAAALTPQQQARITPPGPRLQNQPLQDIATERQREADLLNNYAWIDAAHTRARIPIDRAMALVTGKPLDPPP